LKLPPYVGGDSSLPLRRGSCGGSRWSARSPQSPPYVGWGAAYGEPLEFALCVLRPSEGSLEREEPDIPSSGGSNLHHIGCSMEQAKRLHSTVSQTVTTEREPEPELPEG